MLETVLAQVRFAFSLATGRPFHLRSLDRLIDAIQETRREFGALGAEGAALMTGPALDDETRAEVQLHRFREQAARAARETPYYRRLFAGTDLDPARLDAAQIARLPITRKEALREEADAFVCRSERPVLRAMTTGTTGRPASVHFSAAELQTAVALSTIGFLLSGEVTPEDIVQISTSSRATLGNLGLAGACLRIGAQAYLTGIVEPAQALALLTERRGLAGAKPRTSVLSTYPSYLGALVEEGRRLGRRPADFGLERIFVGGEIVTEGLKERATRLFGPVQFCETYAMTETIPCGGSRCAEGHLHFEPAHGLIEVLDETGAPAPPGAPGTIVATPFPPFRRTTVLLRYDTEDLVRPVAGPLTCNLRTLPATGNLLGKRRLAVRHADGWTAPRDVLEALEGVEAVPLPARCGFRAVPGGVAIDVMTREDTADARRTIGLRLEERGVPLRALSLVQDARLLRDALPLAGAALAGG